MERVERCEPVFFDVARGRENRLDITTDLDEPARVHDDPLCVSLLAVGDEQQLDQCVVGGPQLLVALVVDRRGALAELVVVFDEREQEIDPDVHHEPASSSAPRFSSSAEASTS
jgi:hypothetical protein